MPRLCEVIPGVRAVHPDAIWTHSKGSSTT